MQRFGSVNNAEMTRGAISLVDGSEVSPYNPASFLTAYNLVAGFFAQE
jgi:hypothetical protein